MSDKESNKWPEINPELLKHLLEKSRFWFTAIFGGLGILVVILAFCYLFLSGSNPADRILAWLLLVGIASALFVISSSIKKSDI